MTIISVFVESENLSDNKYIIDLITKIQLDDN